MKSHCYVYLERFLSFFTDKVVCISDDERKSALLHHVVQEKKMELIPNGIDIEAVRMAKAKERTECGIPEDAVIIGMIGRLTPQKAPDIFIRSAQLILPYIKNAFFIIVGDGEDREEIAKYAEMNKIPLLITGWTSEPYSYLKLFDIALLLSRWEGFGLAIAEYMAAGKSLIATQVDAIPSLVKDGVEGLLVSVDSPEEVLEKVLFLYHHPEQAAAMRKHAYEKVVTNYDVQRVARQHLKMFEELMRGRRK